MSRIWVIIVFIVDMLLAKVAIDFWFGCCGIYIIQLSYWDFVNLYALYMHLNAYELWATSTYTEINRPVNTTNNTNTNKILSVHSTMDYLRPNEYLLNVFEITRIFLSNENNTEWRLLHRNFSDTHQWANRKRYVKRFLFIH